MILPFRLLISSFIITIAAISIVTAQDKKGAYAEETVAQIPSLTEFHEVIVPIWHTAWPEKNTAMLMELAPEIKRASNNLGEANLPGILRDKQDTWNKGVTKLLAIAADYENAASALDSVKLLNAAEQLHAQYEMLVRITRPPLKELDAFHRVLYMLYHHYMPDGNLEAIASSTRTLNERMAALSNAKLPDRLQKKETAFNDARIKLAGSVAALDASLAGKNRDAFAVQVESMHTDYQALEAILE